MAFISTIKKQLLILGLILGYRLFLIHMVNIQVPITLMHFVVSIRTG